MPSYTTNQINANPHIYDTGCQGCGCLSCTCSSCGGGDQNAGGPSQGGCGTDDDHRHCVAWNTRGYTNGTQYCPAIGTVASASYIGNTYQGDWNQGQVQLSCTYSSINPGTGGASLFSPTVTNMFPTSVSQQFQSAWCNDPSRQALELDGNRTNCINAYGGGDQAVATYNQKLLSVCSALSGWTSSEPCMNVVSACIRSGPSGANQQNFTTAQQMAYNYCSQGDTATGPGSNRNNSICGCINAEQLGFYSKANQTANCFTNGYSSLPGCNEVATATQAIVSLGNATLQTEFQGIITDTGHLAPLACGPAENIGNSGILPFESQASYAQATIITNICNQYADIGILQDSPIHQQCTINTTVNIGTPASSTPASVSTPSGSTPSPTGPSPDDNLPIPGLGSLLPTPTDQWGAMGVCFAILCLCCVFIIIMSKRR